MYARLLDTHLGRNYGAAGFGRAPIVGAVIRGRSEPHDETFGFPVQGDERA